jgi:hypothetical protein
VNRSQKAAIYRARPSAYQLKAAHELASAIKLKIVHPSATDHRPRNTLAVRLHP